MENCRLWIYLLKRIKSDRKCDCWILFSLCYGWYQKSRWIIIKNESKKLEKTLQVPILRHHSRSLSLSLYVSFYSILEILFFHNLPPYIIILLATIPTPSKVFSCVSLLIREFYSRQTQNFFLVFAPIKHSDPNKRSDLLFSFFIPFFISILTMISFDYQLILFWVYFYSCSLIFTLSFSLSSRSLFFKLIRKWFMRQ